jgi:HK97 family phage major capsid protein
MNTYVVELRRKAIEARNVASQVHAAASAESRGFTEDEQRQWDQAMASAEKFNQDADAAEQREQRLQSVQAPMVNSKTKRGDSEESAMAYYIRTNDSSALRESRASNNTGMNIGTAADGGNVVPTGHYGQIITRRDEVMLANKLGVRRIAGVGTTVNVPLDAEADGEFITKAEMGDDNTTNVFDRDAPALGTVAMTLVKYTKKIELTDELLADEDSNLLNFIAEFVGRGMAKTHNDLLVTAALAGGTAAKTFASASAIAAGEIPDLWYALPDFYATDEASVAWVTRRSTEGVIRQLAGTTNFYYAPTPGGTVGMRSTLWGAPLYNTGKVAAIAASAKSLILGNWLYMGLREGPGLTVLRDPYTVDGKVILKYYFRAVYAVLQAGAIVYGTHPTA